LVILSECIISENRSGCTFNISFRGLSINPQGIAPSPKGALRLCGVVDNPLLLASRFYFCAFKNGSMIVQVFGFVLLVFYMSFTHRFW
jgi:hypothetical protein